MVRNMYVVGAVAEGGRRWQPLFYRKKAGGKAQGYVTFMSKKYAMKVAEDMKERHPSKKLKILKVI